MPDHYRLYFLIHFLIAASVTPKISPILVLVYPWSNKSFNCSFVKVTFVLDLDAQDKHFLACLLISRPQSGQ